MKGARCEVGRWLLLRENCILRAIPHGEANQTRAFTHRQRCISRAAGPVIVWRIFTHS